MTFRALILFAVFCCAGASVSLAEESLQFFYNRSAMNLIRNKAPLMPPALPWLPSQPDNPAVQFDVEIRDATTMYNQKGWFNLSSPSENSGVLMAFGAPGISPIIRSTEFAPLDILLIDSEGKITQIIPNLKLSELTQEIMPDQPVLAFLFIKGGLAQKLSVNPGDTLEYKLFKKSPIVITGDGPRKVTQPTLAEPPALDPQELAPSAYKPTTKEPKDSPIH